jgi:hypothetical protein
MTLPSYVALLRLVLVTLEESGMTVLNCIRILIT